MSRLPPRAALSLLAATCALAACSPRDEGSTARIAEARPSKPAAPTRSNDTAGDETHLTIYSGDYEQLATAARADEGDAPGYVLVDRVRRYALKAGANRIDATGVPRTMDVEAATFRPNAGGVRIVSQRYIAPPSGSADVLAAAVGRRVAVEHTSGGAKQTDSGTLVSASDGLTLALADGRVKVIREYDNFSLVDSDGLLPQRAALQWTVQADAAGDAAFTLDYPMGGMAWRAEYVATLAAGDGCKLDLDGAALVANRSGVTFGDAKLTLVAGEPNRTPRQQQVAATRMAAAAPVVFDDASEIVTERRSGEYHAYELPGAYQVANGTTERVPLFDRLAGVTCRRAFETTPATGTWQPPQPLIDPGYNNDTGPQPVKSTVSLKNDKASGLDRALPAGRVRVFDGRDFLGESMLAHTPKGADIRLEVGTAFDLTAERERSEFRVDRAARSMTESFAITVKNAKTTNATVLVAEPIPRWTDWDIVASSVPARKRDAQHAEFEVKVPAGGETRLTYTARYRWAAGVRP